MNNNINTIVILKTLLLYIIINSFNVYWISNNVLNNISIEPTLLFFKNDELDF